MRRNFKEILEAVRHYLGNQCEYCGKNTNLHIHHKIPVYLGGTNTLGNFEIVCRTCHAEIHKQWNKISSFYRNSSEYTYKKCSTCERMILHKKRHRNKIFCDHCAYKRRKPKDQLRRQRRLG